MKDKGFKTRFGDITKIKSQSGEPIELESGQVIINKVSTKQNLKKLVDINNDSSKKPTAEVTDDGTAGGLLEGPAHYDANGKSLGGIKAIVDGNKQIEVEGKEFVVNKEASKKHWKELSKINQSAGNGVAIGPPADYDEDPKEFKDGGKVIDFNPNHVPSKKILNYAKKIKQHHPEIWKLGGNIFGNEAFVNLKRVSERGYWLDSEEWMYIKWRSYVARHIHDFRIEGVIAMLKWVDKVEKGWQYMKNLIEEEIKKREAKKARKMSTGGGLDESRLTKEEFISKLKNGNGQLKYISIKNKPGKLSKNQLNRNTITVSGFFVYDKNKPNSILRQEEKISGDGMNIMYYDNFDAAYNSYSKIIHKSEDKMSTGGDVSLQLDLIKKAEDISGRNEFLNCDLFCHRMVDNVLFKDEFDIIPYKNNFNNSFEKQYQNLIKVLKVGDIIAFGDKDRVVHYAIYIGNDDVLEVEMWGEKPRKFSLKKNLYSYESIAYIYRKKDQFDKSKMSDGGLIAPNGKPSKLTSEQYKLVRTPEFKAWFGDWENEPNNASKVVDENGEPLVVYHGTKNKFYTFDKRARGSNTDPGIFGKGFYFSKNLQTSKNYGNNILETFLNIRNPFNNSEFKSKSEVAEYLDISEDILTEGGTGIKAYTSFTGIFSDAIKEKGHDGVTTRFGEIVVFEPEQIKLADGSNTTFNKNNPDIRFEKGGGVGRDATELSEILMEHLNDYCKYHYNDELDEDSFMMKTVKGQNGHQVKELSGTTKKGIDVHISIEELYMKRGGNVDAQDTITLDVPLMIRLLELSREDIKSDAELHFLVEKLIELKNKPVLTMDDYAFIADLEHNHLKKFDLGGKLSSNQREVDLGFGGLGNGTTVWDRNRIENNDYKIVAHISNSGNVTYYDKNLPENAKNKIEEMAMKEKQDFENQNGLSSGYEFMPINTPLN